MVLPISTKQTTTSHLNHETQIKTKTYGNGHSGSVLRRTQNGDGVKRVIYNWVSNSNTDKNKL